MIVYNVTVNVDEAIAHEWVAWMKGQFLPALAKMGGYESHRLLHLQDEIAESNGQTFAMQINLKGVEALLAFQGGAEKEFFQLMNVKYRGKYAAFATTLKEI
ncbi:DUF4286 family protein [Algivirga pacifica]|uniref:DUF4286 domain-containing protein n=1 Tax=Algivirga pacifica TaxID=1162670 RepID=A0ABP9D792_9BACT